jgi:DNA adenine methylase
MVSKKKVIISSKKKPIKIIIDNEDNEEDKEDKEKEIIVHDEKLNNHSLLRYPGGKTRACGILNDLLKKHFTTPKTVYSPFFGGGSFEFFVQNKYNSELIVNDKFTPLINFWKVVKENPSDLVTRINELKPLSKELFLEIRNKILTEPDKIKKAAYFYAINRSSFSGATLSGGFSKLAESGRFNKSNIDKIGKINLKCVSFANEDFSLFLKKYNGDADKLIFLDPPYYLENNNLYGNKGDLHEGFDHENLKKILDDKKNWMLCYNDCDYIRTLYEKYTIVEVKWNYGMNKTKKSSEIVIINPVKSNVV